MLDVNSGSEGIAESWKCAVKSEDRSSVSSGNESDESSDIDSPILTSTNTKNSAVDKLPVDKSVATCSSAVQANINTAQRVQSKKSCCSMEVVNPQSDASLLYPTSALSSVPQDVLLQLIQCGHLQLHTEEDGSGHQYVAIPLTSSTANLLKASQSSTTSTVNTKDCLETRNKNEISSSKDKQEYQTNTTSSGLVIKQESV
ncbi:serum response factor homolog [Teleopsis dalmanni]|uniref:serum response factor homolog n=1 Tax=Teleopsis dalmanni TaxID=139649 RepID=UPI0018CFDBB8|nr:serum response factor homolog [Teleopsis dalmanni]